MNRAARKSQPVRLPQGGLEPVGLRVVLDSATIQPIAALARNLLLDENIRHDTFEYWKARDISHHLHNIHCPVLNVGGWFNAEVLAGTFRTYHATGIGIYTATIIC